MGDRLVQIITKDAKFLAATYQHWSASEADEMQNLTEEALKKLSDNEFLDSSIIIKTIKDVLDKHNGNANSGFSNGCLEWNKKTKMYDKEYFSDIDKAFMKEHPEFALSKSRNDGLFTLDERIANSFEGWAEEVNYIDL